MVQTQNHRERALAVARDRGIARSRDFESAGIPRIYLQRLRDEGLLTQPGRGLYELANSEIGAHHSLAEAAKAVPAGVIGLVSALQFHGLTTQLSPQVWLLIPPKGWVPRQPPVSLKIVRAGDPALKAGVEHKLIDKVHGSDHLARENDRRLFQVSTARSGSTSRSRRFGSACRKNALPATRYGVTPRLTAFRTSYGPTSRRSRDARTAKERGRLRAR